jgi:hypothetical protein
MLETTHPTEFVILGKTIARLGEAAPQLGSLTVPTVEALPPTVASGSVRFRKQGQAQSILAELIGSDNE